MIKRAEINKIAWARLKDAKVLFQARRYDGARYLCGYVAEFRLKGQICSTFNWEGYPSNKDEFEKHSKLKLKTHNLDALLRLSSKEEKIKTEFFAEWSILDQWNPEIRYEPIGKVKREDALAIIEAATIFLKKL